MKTRRFLDLLIVTCLIAIANPVHAQSGSDTDTSGAQEDQSPSLKDSLKDKLTVKGLTAEDLKDTMLSVLPKEKSALNVVLENLKGRIPDEKLAELEDKLKDKEFSEEELATTLGTLELSYDEMKTILDNVSDYLDLTEKIRKAGPIILSANNVTEEIRKKEKNRENVQKEEEKAKISEELKSLDSQLKKTETDAEAHIADISEAHLTQLPVILKDLGYDDEKSEIISDHIRDRVEFVKKMKTLETIIQSMDKVREDIGETENKREGAKTEDEKEKLSEELRHMADRLKKLEHDFTVVTTGIDMAVLYEKEGEKEVDWQKELMDIFSPIIVELKAITDRPRRMEMLRGEISYYEKRLPQINQGLEYIDDFMKDVRNEKISERLKASEEFWNQQEKEFATKLETAQHQLFELEKGRMSASESFDYVLESVLRHRGKNIILAIAAFLLTYLVCYFLRRLIILINPFTYIRKYNFLANFADVLLYLLTFIAATVAMILVLYMSGDWVVLAVVIVMLAGVVWAARNMLPLFVEQIKLLLDFGPVRLGERVIHDDIAYRVESIGIYCYLKNPLLQGGTLRLPLRDLIEMRSRPYDEDEPWFPCKKGDYIIINGVNHRQVIFQSPQVIKFDWFEMREKMPTKKFLSKNIFNLSEAPYWTGFTFHIANKHRFLDYNDVVEKLTKMGEDELKKTIYAEDVDYPWADCKGVSADASLEFSF